MGYGYDDWQPYVSVGERKANARSFADKLAKKQNRDRQPIEIQGRKIAKSFWGIAWCDHLESLSDVANRLPRGATYVRNGSVVDLVVQPGKVDAIVAGSDPYEITITIKKLEKKTWNNIKKDCSSAIDSLIDLLGGRLSDGVMQRLTDKKSGCFPSANQIEMDCDCPDWSKCCKHLAAVMYAIGSRLDTEPELLFLLRGVNQEELISQAVSKENLAQELETDSDDLAGEDLGAIFGIELESNSEVTTTTKRKKSNPKSKSASRPKVASAKKKLAKKSTATKQPVKSRKKTTVKKKAVAEKAARKKAVKGKAAKKKVATKKKVSTTKAVKKRKAAKKRKVATTKSTRKKKPSPNPAAKKKSAKSKKQSTSAKKKSKAKRTAKKAVPAAK